MTVTEQTLPLPRAAAYDPERRWERAFTGTTEQIRHVRAALRPLLADCPVADDIILLVSELSANAVAHSKSREPGGQFTVRLQHVRDEYVCGEVEDEGSDWDGNLPDSARKASGLFIVLNLASACGVTHGLRRNRVVWFRKDHPATGDQDGRFDAAIRAAPVAQGLLCPASLRRPGNRSQPTAARFPGAFPGPVTSVSRGSGSGERSDD
jgi:Histidine kinase-like ATPase domain